jgi:hypothetical protein
MKGTIRSSQGEGVLPNSRRTNTAAELRSVTTGNEGFQLDILSDRLSRSVVITDRTLIRLVGTRAGVIDLS